MTGLDEIHPSDDTTVGVTNAAVFENLEVAISYHPRCYIHCVNYGNANTCHWPQAAIGNALEPSKNSDQGPPADSRALIGGMLDGDIHFSRKLYTTKTRIYSVVAAPIR